MVEPDVTDDELSHSDFIPDPFEGADEKLYYEHLDRCKIILKELRSGEYQNTSEFETLTNGPGIDPALKKLGFMQVRNNFCSDLDVEEEEVFRLISLGKAALDEVNRQTGSFEKRLSNAADIRTAKEIETAKKLYELHLEEAKKIVVELKEGNLDRALELYSLVITADVYINPPQSASSFTSSPEVQEEFLADLDITMREIKQYQRDGIAQGVEYDDSIEERWMAKEAPIIATAEEDTEYMS